MMMHLANNYLYIVFLKILFYISVTGIYSKFVALFHPVLAYAKIAVYLFISKDIQDNK